MTHCPCWVPAKDAPSFTAIQSAAKGQLNSSAFAKMGFFGRK